VNANPPGLHEQRTRVTCHLPLGNAPEDKAFAAIINYLRQQRKEHIGVSGYTVSDPGSFYGFWWSPSRRQWVKDPVIMLIVDYKIPLADPDHSLLEYLARLKEQIVAAYSRFGSPQDEIWIVKHSIDLIK